MNSFQKCQTAALLPPEWDGLAECLFQRKEFLQHAEQYNPCTQRYYLHFKEEELLAGACVYTLPIDLFTFSRKKMRLLMQVIGLPASVSASGIFSKSKSDAEMLIRHIVNREHGVILGLNLPTDLDVSPGISMTMLPTIMFDNRFEHWDEYLAAFRSPYRRRAKTILNAFENVVAQTTSCAHFTLEHYSLYMQIMQRTPSKLEVLSFDFFRNLLAPFYLTSYYFGDKLICWHVNCSEEETLYFFFGGHDYRYIDSHYAYFNNLFGIVGETIAGRYAQADLGQTAEIAKIKCGGRPVYKNMFLYHHNPVVRMFLSLAKPLITYHPPHMQLHTQKETSRLQVLQKQFV